MRSVRVDVWHTLGAHATAVPRNDDVAVMDAIVVDYGYVLLTVTKLR